MLIEENKEAPDKITKSLDRIYKAGIALVAVSVLLFLMFFYPVIREEVRYQLARSGKIPIVMIREEKAIPKSSKEEIIYPIDEDFGIVIPKISANSKVIPDVDWQDSKEYQKALAQGVAEAKGSVAPGELGNIFIFAHSGVDFYEAARYNAVFYLLNKLESGDEIYIFRSQKKFTYKVVGTKSVNAEEIQYIKGNSEKKTLTLMTCWPPGTTWKRLLVIAEQQ